MPPATPATPATPAAPAPAPDRDRWAISSGQSFNIGQTSDGADLTVSLWELPIQVATVSWNQAKGVLDVRSTRPDARPVVGGRPTVFARVKVGDRFSVLDNVFEVTAAAEISLVEKRRPAALVQEPKVRPEPAPTPRPAPSPQRGDAKAPRTPTGTRTWAIPTKQTFTIGRDDGLADIKLAGLDLTQRHATVSWMGRAMELRSTAPQARPFVNGRPILHARIAVGARFMIGNHTLEVSAPGEISLLSPQVTAAEPLLRFAAVSLKYRGRAEATLKEMSFELARGEVLAVIGPSGAGKSTMCGGLLGEVSVESGSMVLGQVDLAASRMQASHLVSFVPQQPAMVENLTVYDSLMWVAKLRLARDTPREAREERVDKVIAAMELTNDVSKRVDTLSGGQRKRVSTAMELLSDPLLLVLDEPTSGLDEGLDRKMMDSLRVAAADGCAVIVVTHSMVNIDRADKILALTGKGRLSYFGPPSELLGAISAANWAEVMDRLRADEVTDMRPQLAQPLLGDAAPLAPSPPTRGSLRRHLPRLIGRELARQRQSFRQLATSLVVGVLMTALLAAAASKSGLGGDAKGISSMLIALIVTLTFFSMAQSFSAVVDDRDVIERESRWSISAASMVLARAITCAPLVMVLGVVSVTLYLLLKGSHKPPDPVLLHPFGLLLFGILLPLAAMVVGLLISTVAKSLRQAVFVLMGILALQVVMTGLAPPFEGTPGKILKALAVLTPSRWASAGLGADNGLTLCHPASGSGSPGVPCVPNPGGAPVPGKVGSPFADSIWSHDTAHVWQAAGALAVIAVVALTVSVWILRRQLLVRR
jgi:ABC-type multidrug transport system ATPase subunit